MRKGVTLLEFNGEADHVHLLLEIPPVHSLFTAFNNFQSFSSRLRRERHAALIAASREPVL
jgi:putative transposase